MVSRYETGSRASNRLRALSHKLLTCCVCVCVCVFLDLGEIGLVLPYVFVALIAGLRDVLVSPKVGFHARLEEPLCLFAL